MARGRASMTALSPSCGWAYHARVFEVVNENRPCPDTVSTFENHCLARELTFGDPFQDSGVASPCSEVQTEVKDSIPILSLQFKERGFIIDNLLV